MAIGPKDSQQGFRWILISVGVILGIIFFISIVQNKPTAESQADIQDIFSVTDGSCYPLEQEIKKTMHDPDSYEHVETKHTESGSSFSVVTKFRGKNKLGALVLNTAEATIDRNDGHVINWRMIE